MTRQIKNKIDEAIDAFLYKGSNKTVCRPAGKWQGSGIMSDQLMNIYRDVNLIIHVPKTQDEMVEYCKPDVEWANLHFSERVGGIPLNPGESYKTWPYANFKEGDDFIKNMTFDHTYMERFWPKVAGIDLPYEIANDPNHNLAQEGIRFQYGDFNDVVKQLLENPLTRQAYLPIFFPEDTGANNSIRTPCTLGYLFEIFNNKLEVTYYIRSCDAYRHFRNDVYMAMLLMDHVRNQLLSNDLKVKNGTLRMKIANLHSFNNDYYLLSKKESKLRNLE